MPERSCKYCDGEVKGRVDKIFCSAKCKAYYHRELKEKTRKVAAPTDKILHRNRSILYELMGDKAHKKQIFKSTLDKKNFKYDYMTGYYENAKGKRYHIVYDYAWMNFSDGEVMIVKRT